ncbi:MAG: hybrid sensor histidine kinase/response regulator, partial [Flavobacteriaceae bacterium]
NNPIEAALEDETLPAKKQEQFKVAKRNSDRLLSLVNQLLDLSKIDAGQLKLRIQQGNVNQLIAALADSFAYSAKQKDIEFNVAFNNNESVDYFDKDAVEKIVVNLLSNAVKYTPEKGSISCNSTIKNGRLDLEVKNTGVGITEEEQQNLFQRFYQTSEDNVGTGIGLALVKELVDLHKGDIKVHSVPDQWTAFSVTLPVDRNSFKNGMFVEANDNETSIKPIVTQQVTHEDHEDFIENDQPILLVVEDNADVRTLLNQTFEDRYNILTAENGQVGIDKALEHVPDIIISDIMMPVKDGIALTKELKQNQLTSHVPIVLLTAKAGDDNELLGIETGADDYMTKPFSTKILTTKVAKLVELRQKLHDRYSQELILKPKDIAVNNIDEQFLERIQDVLEDKLVESSFKIEEFSKALGMSRMQLHRKIKALTGLSASEFIRSQRLKLAAQLLKKSDINISQVGYSVGFNDSSYFAKCFKQTYHCTPTEYAKKQA